MRRLRALLADSGPITILAAIAAVGSFDHISHLAAKYGQHGWRSWAVAVCIDLVCVMAAREIQRDKRTGRCRRGLMSWPSLVLAGGIVLTLAANLAEAPRSSWGWILAATPAAAFLIAMSMIERRAGQHEAAPATEEMGLVWEDPTLAPASTDPHPAQHARLDRVDQLAEPLKDAPAELEQASPEPAGIAQEVDPSLPPALVAYARRLADEHHTKHDRPITADVLRARMHVAPELAAALARHVESPD
ncbi:DUF2637 domain-containing protein [Nonomuraea phyllanthi]|uniref:DUF2637 domain-containing protein n=1 Tax=Nonomuraea phyllanthi TaxID=2219224 RepID=UPI0012941098|nr:DUF2637 domain-containing protein [Nonomuraea phyllanthi]QFY13706.1 DUF2637 domain-containing protein [Nonomuraea phyllanthi]